MSRASKNTRPIENRDDAEASFGLRVVAEILTPPQPAIDATSDVEMVLDPESGPSRAYRRLAGKVAEAFAQGATKSGADPADSGEPPAPPGCSVLVTSARDETARSFVAVNLAAALAASGHRALVAIPRGMDAPPSTNGSDPGDRTAEEAPLTPGEIIARARPSWIAGVSSLALGEMFASREDLRGRFDAFVGAAREVVDDLVVEAPLLSSQTGRSLVDAVDLVLVVCELGRTTFEDGAEIRRLLREGTRTAALGLVVVGPPPG